MLDKLLNFLKNHHYPFIIELFKWFLIDLLEKKTKKLHLFGMKLFLGQKGQGKTSTISYYLLNLRAKYQDNIYIFTNYFFKYEDAGFSPDNLKDFLTAEYDKPVVFAIDEIQNIFNARSFKNFPKEIFSVLTQSRKGNGKMILASAQDWDHVDKQFRDLVDEVIHCKHIFGRWFQGLYYTPTDYEEQRRTTISKLRSFIHPIRYLNYIQTDFIRNVYDSYAFVRSRASQEYEQRPQATTT